MSKKIALIIGAGPAGLSAAYKFLTETDVKPIIIEELDTVGGISRSVDFEGNKVDLGGHRFFTKNKSVLDFWKNILPEQGKPAIDDKILDRDINFVQNGADPEICDNVLLKRKRLSRIFYLKKFFDYPLSINPNTILNLGLYRTAKAGFSYIKSSIFKRKEYSLEDFMINRFGNELYKTFFENYTQKVWGKHPKEISKEWGEQRIKGLSLLKAVLNTFNPKNVEPTLVKEFWYPKLGCGQIWEVLGEKIIQLGGEIHLNAKVIQIDNRNNKINSLKVLENGNEYDYYGDYILSSMPVKDFVSGLKNVEDKEVLEISKKLPYRDYILASFFVNKINFQNNIKIKSINNICPDNWIYVQEPCVKMARIQILNNWSPYAVKDFQNKVCVSFEYMCQENDKYWNMSDESFIEFAIKEAEKIKIFDRESVVSSKRINVPKAYPAYFEGYNNFDKVKDFLNSIENLYCIGRNGQHKYNNMDHSVLSGFEAVKTIKENLSKDTLWNVNTEKDYHEA